MLSDLSTDSLVVLEEGLASGLREENEKLRKWVTHGKD